MKRLFDRYFDPNLVLVYQFGKVGSTTLANAINSAVNVHDLYANPISPATFRLRNPWTYRWFGFPADRAFRRLCINLRKQTDVVVPVREPFARNLSMFFQDLPFWYVKHFSENRAYAKNEGNSLLKQVFLETFDHDGCDRWFKNEFCRFVGLGFDDLPFDRTEGFSLVENKRRRCLLLTTDRMSASDGMSIVSDFLGRPIEIESQNRGNEKWYAEVYEKFGKDKPFVDAYKKRMSDSAVQKKFFG